MNYRRLNKRSILTLIDDKTVIKKTYKYLKLKLYSIE